MRRIRAIWFGDELWSVGIGGVERIEEVEKSIGRGYYNDLTLLHYNVHMANGRMISVEAGRGVEVHYDPEQSEGE